MDRALAGSLGVNPNTTKIKPHLKKERNNVFSNVGLVIPALGK